MKQRHMLTPEGEAKVALEVISGVKSPAEVCCRHNLKPKLLAGWKSILLQKTQLVFQWPEECGRKISPQRRTGTLGQPHELGDENPKTRGG